MENQNAVKKRKNKLGARRKRLYYSLSCANPDRILCILSVSHYYGVCHFLLQMGLYQYYQPGVFWLEQSVGQL